MTARLPMVHDLKVQPADFAAIRLGTKVHEARFNDRDFRAGDALRLLEWTPKDPGSCSWPESGKASVGTYSGQVETRVVTHVTQGVSGLPTDLCIMSIPVVVRQRLPKRRRKVSAEFTVGGMGVLVEIGLYHDGRPGEVFLTTSKPGSDLRCFIDGYAIAISALLQFGVPVESIAHMFENLSGGPAGEVKGHVHIKQARSIIDLVARLLRAEYGEKK